MRQIFMSSVPVYDADALDRDRPGPGPSEKNRDGAIVKKPAKRFFTVTKIGGN